jgi:hypothetical protein
MATHLSGAPRCYAIKEKQTTTGKLKLPHRSSQSYSSMKPVSYMVFLYDGINGVNLLAVFWWEFYVFAIRGLMKRKISIFIDGFKTVL